MDSFSFRNPTNLVFGPGSIARLPQLIPADSRILMVYGGGSIKQNGVYDAVTAQLQPYFVSEFAGIEANPTVQTIRRAVAQAQREQCNFVLAVGGGSVIDACKLISAAVPVQTDPWEIVLKGTCAGPFVPLATVLTIPATGSEMNAGSVISNADTQEKYSFRGQYPLFSVLDPTVPFSLPPYQVACGIADTWVHVMEQYLTWPGQSRLMDRWAEGICLTLREIAPELTQDHRNAPLMSDFMVCATMALNGYLGWGVVQDWATHRIGHEITALTGLTHGHTLAILLPSTMRVMKDLGKREKLLQYARRIWEIEEPDEDQAIEEAIGRTADFFTALGLPGKLSLCHIDQKVCREIVRRFRERGTILGERANVDYQVVEQILADAY